MKATIFKGGKAVKIITVRFLLSAPILETAIVSLLYRNKKVSRMAIKEVVEYIFYSGGQDGHLDWVTEDDLEKHIDKARAIAQNWYPSFYQTPDEK